MKIAIFRQIILGPRNRISNGTPEIGNNAAMLLGNWQLGEWQLIRCTISIVLRMDPFYPGFFSIFPFFGCHFVGSTAVVWPQRVVDGEYRVHLAHRSQRIEMINNTEILHIFYALRGEV